jgi:hypothetical protein
MVQASSQKYCPKTGCLTTLHDLLWTSTHGQFKRTRLSFQEDLIRNCQE